MLLLYTEDKYRLYRDNLDKSRYAYVGRRPYPGCDNYRKSPNKRRVSVRRRVSRIDGVQIDCTNKRRVSIKRRVPNKRRVTGWYDGMYGNLLI